MRILRCRMSPMRQRLPYLLGALLVAAAVAGAVVWWLEQEGERTPSVAVLPFASDTGGPGTRYFADGFHDTIISQLSRIQRLKVIARTSVLEYREGPRDLRKIAET